VKALLETPESAFKGVSLPDRVSSLRAVAPMARNQADVNRLVRAAVAAVDAGPQNILDLFSLGSYNRKRAIKEVMEGVDASKMDPHSQEKYADAMALIKQREEIDKIRAQADTERQRKAGLATAEEIARGDVETDRDLKRAQAEAQRASAGERSSASDWNEERKRKTTEEINKMQRRRRSGGGSNMGGFNDEEQKLINNKLFNIKAVHFSTDGARQWMADLAGIPNPKVRNYLLKEYNKLRIAGQTGRSSESDIERRQREAREAREIEAKRKREHKDGTPPKPETSASARGDRAQKSKAYGKKAAASGKVLVGAMNGLIKSRSNVISPDYPPIPEETFDLDVDDVTPEDAMEDPDEVVGFIDGLPLHRRRLLLKQNKQLKNAYESYKQHRKSESDALLQPDERGDSASRSSRIDDVLASYA
jgi:hypothetical protein